MEKNEKLVKDISALVAAADKPIFSDEDYALFKKCGLTDEQIKGLEEAEMMSGVVDVLPNDDAGLKRLAGALGAISKADPKESLANLNLIAEKDPQMLAQLMALTAIAENEVESK